MPKFRILNMPIITVSHSLQSGLNLPNLFYFSPISYIQLPCKRKGER